MRSSPFLFIFTLIMDALNSVSAPQDYLTMLPRTNSNQILISVFIAIGILFFSDYSEAHKVEEFERKIKLKILPEYCAYLQAGPRAESPDAARYKSYLGADWKHTHHYCWGLDKMLLASLNIPNKVEWRGYLASAVDDFNYVLKYTLGYHYILNPEILSRKGMALSLLGRDAEAANAFLSAIKLKPDYVFPYIQLSKLYSKNGEIEEARKVLDRALEHSPNSPLLKQALAKPEKKIKIIDLGNMEHPQFWWSGWECDVMSANGDSCCHGVAWLFVVSRDPEQRHPRVRLSCEVSRFFNRGHIHLALSEDSPS